MEYKRLLIISHNCFSKTGSNGRTLANYLNGWQKEKLAQIYIHPEMPDFDICSQYYCISDMAVLKSIVKRDPAGFVVQNTTYLEKSDTTIDRTKSRKNSLMFLMRELAWKSKLWNYGGLEKWLDDFAPEIILVQAGDAAFLFDLAISVGKKYNAEIAVYNTEGYYFKKISYLKENKVSKRFYPILNLYFKKAYSRLVCKSKVQIYNCNLLAEDYEATFHTGSKVIMNTSEFTNEAVFYPKKKKILYAGNLGLYRHISLIEFANAVQQVDPNMKVDVYGRIPDEVVKAQIDNCSAIRFHGFISYEKLKKELRESQFLLHVESFDAFYKEDLKYAFSTKIADSLAAGSCLFVYAPENMAVIQYLQGKEAAALITTQEFLKEKIAGVLQDELLCQTYAENGRKLAERNHNLIKNREEFQKILLT